MNTRAIDVPAIGGRPGQPELWQSRVVVPGLVALFAVSIQAFWIPIDADVSWLLTVCERILAGDRLYVDIFEVNPPASVWMYLPLVWLAELIGARPEPLVVAAFVAAGLLSICATLSLVSRLDRAPEPVLLAGVLSFICLVLPMALFAQREHAALLLAFPSLTALAVIAEGKPLSRRALYASGIAAGLIIIIKPYFVAAVVGPALWVAFKRHSPSPLLPPIAAASVAIGLYAIALIVFASAYFEWLPVIAHTYGSMHEVIWKVAIGPALYPAICLALALLLRAPRVSPLVTVWSIGSVGFLLAAYAQAKNYPNHWLPQAALALAAVFAILSTLRTSFARRSAVGIALAAVALSEMYHWAIVPDQAVAAAIQKSAPPAPKIIALSPQLVTGHPVTRNVGGRWVGSRAGLFTASGARFVGLDDPLALQSFREDTRSFARDVERHSPDVVLVHARSKSWLMREPVIARAMSEYRFAERADETEIWVRRRARR